MESTEPAEPDSPHSTTSAWSGAKKAMERKSTRALAWGNSIREYNQKKVERSMSSQSPPTKKSVRATVQQCLRRYCCFCFGPGEGDLPQAVTIATDVEDLKQSVRQKMSKQTYSVKDYYKSHGIFQRIAKSNYFENFTLFIIGVNSLWIAFDTDNNDAAIITEAKVEFQIVENIFCAFFTFEWLVRWMAFRRTAYAFMDAWFVFDTLLVTLMILETWITPIVLGMLSISSDGIGDASILRLVRLLRLARMTRVAKLLRAFPEVLIMIKGISAAGRSVFFTICLLILVLYIFGIAFKQICVDTKTIGVDKFPTVPEAMLTLLIHGVFMDDMAELVAIVKEESSVAFGLFIIFVLIASITLMNMLIGVLCEVVSMVGQSEREELLVDLVKRELLDIIISADEDGDGLMSHAEFLRILESSEGLKALETVGVDPVGLIDYADQIFAKENGDEGQQETILFSHFMNEILQLRGSNTCTVKDLINMRKVVERSSKDFKEQLGHVTTHLTVLEEKLEDLKVKGPVHEKQENSLAKPELSQTMSKTLSKGVEQTPRDLSPVLLQAHMPPNPTGFRKTTGNMKVGDPNLYSSVANAWGTATKTYFPDMEGSLSQKLLEMQGILNELILGPHSSGGSPVVAGVVVGEANGDAAGGKPREVDVANQNLRRAAHRGDASDAREREAHKRDDSRARFTFRVYGRPLNGEDIPRGRVLGRYLGRRPSRERSLPQ
ncbi:para [Symbiodinium natans]|uniref:Para protein n=1 Tax=Symbiodinium natans TaxID=878477 RepID=A0A812QUJ6_9DINO|nr:para [Symbiodinium natans]